MPIPNFRAMMLPTLEFAADGKEFTYRDAGAAIAESFSLTEEEINEQVPSGKKKRLRNNLSWAIFALRKHGLLESIRPGSYKITQKGHEALKLKPDKIDRKFLEAIGPTPSREGPNDVDLPDVPPDEFIPTAYREHRAKLASELLQNIRSCSPHFFENLVVELLVAMGYGGSLADAGRAVGKSGDGGIDGIIKEDRLGLDVVYIQAKRWEGNVSRPEIQKFAGALQGHRAKKGVFITTSGFTKDALDFVSHIDSKIVLIDGDQLAELMIDHNIGVSLVEKYELKRVDSDYFIEE
jgi:restriction system protein